MQNIIIVGAGGFGREVLALIERLNEDSARWNVLGFIDDNLHALDNFDLGYSILGTISEWTPIADEQYAMAIASPQLKKEISEKLKGRGMTFATLIHPDVSLGKRASLGEGVILFEHTIVDIDVKLDDFVFINTFCTIGHDAVIGRCTTIAPSVGISGTCKVGQCVNIGGHSYIIPGRKVGDHAVIAAGSIVFSNVREKTTVLGNPAKRMKAIENE